MQVGRCLIAYAPVDVSCEDSDDPQVGVGACASETQLFLPIGRLLISTRQRLGQCHGPFRTRCWLNGIRALRFRGTTGAGVIWG
jgi:hypothetical protein